MVSRKIRTQLLFLVLDSHWLGQNQERSSKDGKYGSRGRLSIGKRVVHVRRTQRRQHGSKAEELLHRTSEPLQHERMHGSGALNDTSSKQQEEARMGGSGLPSRAPRQPCRSLIPIRASVILLEDKRKTNILRQV